LVRIEVTTTTTTLAQGTSVQYQATGIYRKKGKRVDLTDRVTWSAVDGSVATVSNGPVPGSSVLTAKGTVSGLVAGSTTITATLGKVAGNAPVTVTNASLVSIAIDPPSPSIANGTTQQLTATGHFSDATHQDLTASAAWSSSDQGVATISNTLGSQGLASAGAVGSTTITATFGGISGSTTLTVTAATLVSIDVTPPDPSIATGTTQQFTATGVFTDTTTQDLTSSATWSSSAEGVATISNALGSEGLATGNAAGATTITAAFGGLSDSTTLTVTAAVLVTLEVTPDDSSIASGGKQQFTATGAYTDNSTQDLTTSVTWSSSDDSVAAISNAGGSEGLATGSKVGETTITATLGTISDSTTLTVTAATLVSIAVTPVDPSIASGKKQQFTATGTYTDDSTRNITTSVTWSSSDEDVATISNASGSDGRATGKEEGVTTIRATSASISGTARLRVTAATLVSIEVTPANPSIVNGTTKQFTATGVFTDDSKENLTSSATWSSSDKDVATISNAGSSRGRASSKEVGSTTIKATLDGISGSTTLTVTEATLAKIDVTPANPSITEGTKKQFKATGAYTDSSTQDVTQEATWSSSDEAVATISNAGNSRGLATGSDVGSTKIQATLDGISGSTTLTVTAATLLSIEVRPANTSIASGTKKQFTALGTYNDNSSADLTTEATWSSSEEDVATISNADGSEGLATGSEVGKTTIQATFDGVSGSTTLTVTAGDLVSIEVTPEDPSIPGGKKQEFKATGKFGGLSVPQDITASVTWSSSDTDVATISNADGSEGVATAEEPGETTIKAALGGKSGSTTLTVTLGELLRILVTPNNPEVPAGLTQQFKATGFFAGGVTREITNQVTWSSSDEEFVTISKTGLATAVAQGEVITIKATLDEVSGSTQMTVTDVILLRIDMEPTDFGLKVNQSFQMAAIGVFSTGFTGDVTGEADWSSSNSSHISVNNGAQKGLVTAGDQPGLTVTITAKIGEVSAGTQVTTIDQDK